MGAPAFMTSRHYHLHLCVVVMLSWLRVHARENSKVLWCQRLPTKQLTTTPQLTIEKTDENATRTYLNNDVSHAHALSRIALSMLAFPLARGGSSVRERRAVMHSGSNFSALCVRR